MPTGDAVVLTAFTVPLRRSQPFWRTCCSATGEGAMCEGCLRGGSLCSGYGGLDLAVEWVMALPADWVIDVPGLTRRQQLTMLGNGVAPIAGSSCSGGHAHMCTG